MTVKAQWMHCSPWKRTGRKLERLLDLEKAVMAGASMTVVNFSSGRKKLFLLLVFFVSLPMNRPTSAETHGKMLLFTCLLFIDWDVINFAFLELLNYYYTDVFVHSRSCFFKMTDIDCSVKFCILAGSPPKTCIVCKAECASQWTRVYKRGDNSPTWERGHPPHCSSNLKLSSSDFICQYNNQFILVTDQDNRAYIFEATGKYLNTVTERKYYR